MRTREEHLQFCKKRANEYLAQGEVANAITSMLSDLEQHPETKLHKDSVLAMLGMLTAASGNMADARRFIDGFH